MSITVVSPYRCKDKTINSEVGLSRIDKVERGGYISPDKKIEAFIQSGTLLQNYRAGGDEYEIQGTESDYDPDSSEYVEELSKEALEYNEEVMPQFFDKISANEILDEADKALETASNRSKRDKTRKDPNEASERLVEALNKVSDTISKKELSDKSNKPTGA